MTLKEKLLATGFFIDNEYLNKYIELVSISYNNADEYTERHHIIPFSYFVRQFNAKTKKEKLHLRQQSIKNGTLEYALITQDNISYLSFYQHCLAHYYLYFCTIKELKWATEYAFRAMAQQNINLNSCSEVELVDILKKLSQLQQDPFSEFYKTSLINKIIKKYYSNYGYKKCKAVLTDTYNIYITALAIKQRARLLGIKSNNYSQAWTKAELNILYKNYEKYGYKKCLTLLPQRTKAAIQARAKYLGLKAPGPSKLNSKWDSNEDCILYTYYEIGGSTQCKCYLPNRTIKAIKHRAQRLQLKYRGNING